MQLSLRLAVKKDKNGADYFIGSLRSPTLQVNLSDWTAFLFSPYEYDEGGEEDVAQLRLRVRNPTGPGYIQTEPIPLATKCDRDGNEYYVGPLANFPVMVDLSKVTFIIWPPSTDEEDSYPSSAVYSSDRDGGLDDDEEGNYVNLMLRPRDEKPRDKKPSRDYEDRDYRERERV